ncbi:MAG: TIGR04076 family protein [Desulfobacteraceae bacterium]|nr:TIGR04076 family protein [Desulfobacteraceae bacterium]
MPVNFCQWAWTDIRKDIIAIIYGVQYAWYTEKGMMISGCSDWFKPVLFKIEKLPE